MNLVAKQKEAHRDRKPIYGHQKKYVGRNKLMD